MFIAYAHEDREWVRDLAGALEQAGVTPAYDELLVRPGDVIVHSLDEALRASANGLLVYSGAALASHWVAEEYATLMLRSVQDGRRFIPVLIEDVELPPFAASRYHADFRNADAAAYDRLVGQIVEAVRRP